MQLEKITFTGADNNTPIGQMLELSDAYPSIEWGILVASKSNISRYPGGSWIEDLCDEIGPLKTGTNLSCHVCGKYVRDLFAGGDMLHDDHGAFIQHYCQRIQINTHGEKFKINTPEFLRALKRFFGKQIIIQLDGENDVLLDLLKEHRANAVGLYDMSSGAGVLPKNWPSFPDHKLVGYAGGLGPDNITDQLSLIGEAAQDRRIWIDMETHVRDEHDQFCLEKVKAVVTKIIK